MAMNYNLWKGTLLKVNSDKDLKKDNLINKVSYELRHKSGEYLDYREFSDWKESNFDVNYLFEVVDDVLVRFGGQVQGNKLTLLHLAVHFNLENIVNVLLDVDGINVNAVDSHEQHTRQVKEK